MSGAPAARGPTSRATAPAAPRLVERVHAAGPRPEGVARAKRVPVAVRDDVDLTVEHVVRLLERVVVGVRAGSRLVVDHEHRVELRVEPLVDEHLHGDPAVGEDGGRHAPRHGRRAHRLARLEAVEVHLAVREQEEVVVARVAHVERDRFGFRRAGRGRRCRSRRRAAAAQPSRSTVRAPRNERRGAPPRVSRRMRRAGASRRAPRGTAPAPPRARRSSSRRSARARRRAPRRARRASAPCGSSRACRRRVGTWSARSSGPEARRRARRPPGGRAGSPGRPSASSRVPVSPVTGTPAGSTTAEDATAAARSGRRPSGLRRRSRRDPHRARTSAPRPAARRPGSG